MPRYIAFLRAINVGGHTVKMDHLRALFESLGFSNVATFIASGNVIFESADTNTEALERQIEDHLERSLGYGVATFIRTPAELTAIERHQAFPASDLEAPGSSLYIAFLPAPATPEAQRVLMGFRTEIDDFHCNEREIYWRCRTRMSDSAFSGALLEKALGMPATMRNVTTVRRLVQKYASAAGEDRSRSSEFRGEGNPTPP